ncbi:hypothetical protein MNBD_IGNAVI01-3221 [hydrothermal vent metagenome]|uniref:Secretion system C-terminal sorting domain-containing protein n=1 Tax=hydrothermal vent metagenome TaxID=652676 RepID=A0A3B1CRW7_9ZZZZ
MQNYPNPFNPSTITKHSIPHHGGQVNVALSFSSSRVILKAYDILGREVTILTNKEQPPGNYKCFFDVASINRKISSGIYFYRLSSELFETKQMILLY